VGVRSQQTGGLVRQAAEPLRLDRLIRAGTIHSMTGETYRSVGLHGAEIAAVSPEPMGWMIWPGPVP